MAETTSQTAGHGGPQVRIQLTTRAEDIALPNEPEILVSTGLRRLHLSQLVNNILSTPKPIPFEFLINGQLLRTTLEDFLTQNGISAETVLSVEYVRALRPPVHIASFEHDDWVSSVDVLSRTAPVAQWAGQEDTAQGRIVSGSYDGHVRVWDMSGNVLATSPDVGGHALAVKDVKLLSPSKLVSAGMDRVVRIWDYTEGAGATTEASLTPSLELYGHKSSVDSVAVHGPSSRIVAAGADSCISLFSSRKSENPSPNANLLPSSGSSKRRKLFQPAGKPTPQRGPMAILNAHTSPVSSVIFAPNDHTVAHSTSQDHTLRTWDLPTATLVDTRTLAHPLLSLTSLKQLNLLAAGTSARHITLVDPRASATTVAAMTLRGHTNAVVALAPDPESDFRLVSGSHDGSCKVWDVRAVRAGQSGTEGAVGTSVWEFGRESDSGKKKVAGQGVKVFGVRWDKTLGIVSAGEDRRVQVNQAEGVGGG